MGTNNTNITRRIRAALQEVYAVEEAGAVAQMLAEELFGISRLDSCMGRERALTEAEEQTLEQVLVRLRRHEPVQYVLGYADFCGLRFAVDERVLIPRPETAEMVEMIVREHPEAPRRILDIGTGSGCIPITLSSRWTQSEVFGWDVSEEALAVARQNNGRLHTAVCFERHDILHEEVAADTVPFDLIVSNPPYIKECEREAMERNVLDWEPELALFVPDRDPLLFYRTIATKAEEGLLAPGGWLYFEVNRAHGEETADLLRQHGFCQVECCKDFAGNVRVVKGRKL